MHTLNTITKSILVLSLLCSTASYSYAKSIPLTKQNIIKACLGEAIGESIEGKEAVIRAILNRKSLKGVYGLNNPVVKKSTPKDYKQAELAYNNALTRDITGGAIGWGNEYDLKQFKKTTWFKKCYITKKIGNHYFYAVKQ